VPKGGRCFSSRGLEESFFLEEQRGGEKRRWNGRKKGKEKGLKDRSAFPEGGKEGSYVSSGRKKKSAISFAHEVAKGKEDMGEKEKEKKS